MAYRRLLVLLEQNPADTHRIEAAIRLAKLLDSQLVGLAPTGLLDLPSSPGAAGALAEYAALAWDLLREQAVQATQRFGDRCHAAGLRAFEAVVDEADTAESLLRHAHCCDLVLLTQADADGPHPASNQQLVEQVVLRSARPVLILPHAGGVERFGGHAMLAWDDSPQAARAVADALPMLARSEKVTVVAWAEHGLQPQRSQLDNLCRWLLLHGVSAEARIEPAPTGIADAMLSTAADLGADLLVMGAYGHSRWSELLLGGATRGVLRKMTVPALMSH